MRKKKSSKSTLCKRKFSDKYGEKKRKIGSGTYSDVFETNKSYAIKHITQDLRYNIVELSILRSLNHPNIINIIEIQMEPEIQFVMPLAHETLDTYYIDTPITRKQVYYQILRGLAYCHSRYVCHLDIKPENILVFLDDDIKTMPIIKLADFNISNPYMRPNAQKNRYVQTLWYRAPELILEDQKPYTDKVDIWSVGVLLLNDTTGRYLLRGGEYDQIYKIYSVIGGEYNDHIYLGELDKLLVIPDDYNFIEKLLRIDPEARISSEEAMKDTYFDEVRADIENHIQAKSILSKNIIIHQNQPKIPKMTGWLTPYRKILYEWMYKVTECYKLKSETVFYAYILMDLFSEQQKLKKSELQLYGSVSMIIGEWMYEISSSYFSDYSDISDNAFTADKVKEGSENLIKKLDFNLKISSCMEFIRNYTGDSILSDKMQKYVDLILLALILHYHNKYTQADYAQLALEFICDKIPKLRFKYQIDTYLNQKPGYIPNMLTDEIKKNLGSFKFNDNELGETWKKFLLQEDVDEDDSD